MEKKEFLNMFKESDKIIAAIIFEKMEKAYKTGQEIMTDEFVTREVSDKVLQSASKFGVKAELFGFFEDAERNIIGFSEYGISIPAIKILKIKCGTKFRELKHSDFLGALMSIGLKREKFGDMVLKSGECYVPCDEKSAEIIVNNLNQIATVPCKIKSYDYYEIEPVTPDFEEIIILAASFRADSMVSEICNISRREAEEIIENGSLSVNYSEIKEKSYNIKESSVVSIKRYGKYIIDGAIGESKSGKIRIKCRKYT